MKRLLLIERYGKTVRIEPGDCVVSLTPQANFALEKAGIPYQIPQDFGTEEEIQKRQAAYWEEQLSWFKEIDRFLWDRVPLLKERGIRPAFLYGYFLKSWLDYRFIHAVEAAALLRQGFQEVIFWPESNRPISGNFLEVCSNPFGVASQVWSHLCRNSGVAFHLQTPEPAFQIPFAWKPVLDRLKTTARHYFPRTALKSPETASSTFLFLDQGYDLATLISEAQSAGHRCLVRQANRIPLLNRQKTSSFLEQEFRKAAEEIFASSSPIWQWPNRWGGAPMVPLMAEPLQEWVRTILPEMTGLSEDCRRLYQNENIQRVFTTGLLSNVHIAAVAACEPKGETQSVLIAHGDGPDQAPAWDLFELFPFQHYWVPNEEFARYFQDRRLRYDVPSAQVHVGNYRWQKIRNLPSSSPEGRRPPELIPSDKPVLVYVCGKPEQGVRYLHVTNYSDVWYDQLQTKLLKIFAQFPEYTIVIKLFPERPLAGSTLERRIAELKAPHIQVSRASFQEWLPWANRVILDTPSTPLYEAALMGVPFHLLLRRDHPMRASALAPFEGQFTWYDRIDEAAESVTRYLQTPNPPAARIEPEGEDLLKSLQTIALSVPSWTEPIPVLS